jgi:cytochrome c-type biogenesis protein CcsB
MDPTRELLDQTLLKIGIAAYVTGALVLFAYFLSRRPILRAIGMPLAIAGAVAQFAELGARWWMTGVWPLTNLYGSLSLFSAVAVTIFVIFAYRYHMDFIGGPVLALAAIALGYATTWNEGYMPAVPALQSYWIKIHVPIVISAYASFMLAFCLSVLYLFKAGVERHYHRRKIRVRGVAATGGANIDIAVSAYAARPMPGVIRTDTPGLDAAAETGDSVAKWLTSLPSLAMLDIMQYRVIAVGLPLLSLGIITGAMWAKEAWGAYWQWDPKETAALFSWIVYAAYMHLHTRPNLRGTFTAWVSVVGFFSIVFCYLGVNIFISGLHSYKM